MVFDFRLLLHLSWPVVAGAASSEASDAPSCQNPPLLIDFTDRLRVDIRYRLFCFSKSNRASDDDGEVKIEVTEAIREQLASLGVAQSAMAEQAAAAAARAVAEQAGRPASSSGADVRLPRRLLSLRAHETQIEQ